MSRESRRTRAALTGVDTKVGCRPAKRKLAGSIPGQGAHVPGLQVQPQSERMQEASD